MPIPVIPYENAVAQEIVRNNTPCPEGQFLDLAANQCRKLAKNFGFDAELFYHSLGPTTYKLEACTSQALELLLARVGPRGGIIDLPSCTILIDRKLFLPNNVIFQGTGMGRTILKAVPGFTAPILQAKKSQNIIVRNLTIDGVKSARLLLSIWYADNILVERVRARRAAGTGIQFRYAQRVTIRYSKSFGHKQWNGISSKDCFPKDAQILDEKECRDQAGILNPGVLWSENYAIYSNELYANGGHGLDTHASNGEIAGNLIYDNPYGAKFPDAANLWIHHNTIRESQLWGIYIYSTLEIPTREPHNIVFYSNQLGQNGLIQARINQPAREIYFLSNVYPNSVNLYRIKNATVYRCCGTQDADVYTYGRRPKFATPKQCILSKVGRLFEP
ncbi:right-handed parallel beta-helix repeat-containing protein [Chloroflexi bacterium TSY]|nr:right-handed parallel beta-helix repeat-containing protein [Chloroflexi bacterium TSY]